MEVPFPRQRARARAIPNTSTADNATQSQGELVARSEEGKGSSISDFETPATAAASAVAATSAAVAEGPASGAEGETRSDVGVGLPLLGLLVAPEDSATREGWSLPCRLDDSLAEVFSRGDPAPVGCCCNLVATGMVWSPRASPPLTTICLLMSGGFFSVQTVTSPGPGVWARQALSL